MTAISVANLDQERANTFADTLARILSTEIARTTFAYIVDGIPTEEYFRICTGGTREDLFGRTGPTSMSLQLADDFCRSFKPHSMCVDTKVLSFD